MTPRLLLISDVTHLEWGIRPLLEEWADVAAYDAPGVGEEPAGNLPVVEGIVERGVQELDARGWDRCVLVADEMAIVPAVRLAARRTDAVSGLALGHACLRYDRHGDRRTINGDVFDGWLQMLHTNYAALVRQDIRTWDPRLDAVRDEAAADALARRWLARVPPEVAERIAAEFLDAASDFDLGDELAGLSLPLLLAEHHGCIGWTAEGFQDAASAFPEATIFRGEVKPSVDPDFSVALREFCSRVPG